MKCFSDDYFDARGKFLRTCVLAGCEIETLQHPDVVSRDGRPLAIDVARKGASGASHILFTVCGTHGIEGYAGSAAQIQLLEGERLNALPAHVAAVFVHGLNPYGWDRNSQRNEDGIDMNRNFIDFSKERPVEDSEAIDLMAAVLDIEEMSFPVLAEALAEVAAIRERLGVQRFIQRVSGQYSNPRGWKYGGARPCWSNLMYRQIVRTYLSRAACVAELDWHTGLGRFGDVVPLCFASPGSEEFDVTSQWWGVDAVNAGLSVWAPGSTDVPTPDYRGLAHAGLKEELPRAHLAGGVVEFGTMPLNQIGLVVILDHWLTFKAGPDDDLDFWRAQMRTFMAPRHPAWEASVLKHADQLYANTLDGLAAWRRS